MEKFYKIQLNSPESLEKSMPHYLLVKFPATDDTPEMKEEMFSEEQAKEIRDAYVAAFHPDYSVDLVETDAFSMDIAIYTEWER